MKMAGDQEFVLNNVYRINQSRAQSKNETIRLIGLRAFKLAAVEFIDENGGGPDVKLRKDRRNLGTSEGKRRGGRRR